MKINIQMIQNNYEWIKNNQIANDIIKLLGFAHQFDDASKEVFELTKTPKLYKHTFEKEDIGTEEIDMNYIKTNKNKISYKYKGIFDLFYQMNSTQKNKDTYLPNLYGLILISHSS